MQARPPLLKYLAALFLDSIFAVAAPVAAVQVVALSLEVTGQEPPSPEQGASSLTGGHRSQTKSCS